jgi:replicative DNA helicase
VPDDATKLHDVPAERALLGSLLVYRGRVGDFGTVLEPGDFFSATHARIFSAMLAIHGRGDPVDVITVTEQLRRDGAEDVASSVEDLSGDSGVVVPNRAHAMALVTLRAARDVRAAAGEAIDAVQRGVDPYDVAGSLTERLGTLGQIGIVPDGLSSYSDFIDTPERDAPVVIPGIAYADTRIIVVSSEGAGKSTWMRQIAWCASQGLHPFKFTAIEPIPVLMVDLENPSRELRQSGALLRSRTRRAAGDIYDPSRIQLLRRPQGGDIRERRFRAELEGALEVTRPKLVTIGPVNKMAYRRGNETHEDLAESTQRVLDDLRTRFGFALIIEAHAPHGESGRRDLRPMNSMRWLSWPDVVLGLRKDEFGFEVEHARGDRGAFEWPARFDRDTAWPFVGRKA